MFTSIRLYLRNWLFFRVTKSPLIYECNAASHLSSGMIKSTTHVCTYIIRKLSFLVLPQFPSASKLCRLFQWIPRLHIAHSQRLSQRSNAICPSRRKSNVLTIRYFILGCTFNAPKNFNLMSYTSIWYWY